jgi:hypothetical protein
MKFKQSAAAALAIATTFSTPYSTLAQTLTPSQLTKRTIERRAIEAANSGMPVVNFDRMVQTMLGAKGAFWLAARAWKCFLAAKLIELAPLPFDGVDHCPHGAGGD